MAKRDTQRETRPPQRRGHYSEDGRSWWDEGSGRWFPLTDDQDTLEDDARPGRLWKQARGHQGHRRLHRRAALGRRAAGSGAAGGSRRGPEGYDAFVNGSAVYGGRWTQQAIEFIRRHRAKLASRPVWLFSSGPIGTMATRYEPVEPKGVTAIRRALGPRDHRVFFGAWDRSRLDPSQLGLAERIIAKRLPEGNWRDWPAIEAWAVGIAQKLRAPQPATR